MITLFRAVQANGNRTAPMTFEKAVKAAAEMESPYIVHRLYSAAVDPTYACRIQTIECTRRAMKPVTSSALSILYRMTF